MQSVKIKMIFQFTIARFDLPSERIQFFDVLHIKFGFILIRDDAFLGIIAYLETDNTALKVKIRIFIKKIESLILWDELIYFWMRFDLSRLFWGQSTTDTHIEFCIGKRTKTP